jgi:hypothetical protein
MADSIDKKSQQPAFHLHFQTFLVKIDTILKKMCIFVAKKQQMAIC